MERSEHPSQPSQVGEFKNRKGWWAAVTSLDAGPLAPPHPPTLLLLSVHPPPYVQELPATQLYPATYTLLQA